jgi:chaperonin GroES
VAKKAKKVNKSKVSTKGKKAKKVVAAKSAPKKTAKKAVKKGSKPARPARPTKGKGSRSTPQLVKPVPGRASKKSSSPWAFVSPVEDRVLIFRSEASDRTPGGLYIPDTVASRPNQGKVLAVGRGKASKRGVTHRLDVQVGDVVLFGAYTGQTLEFDGTEYILLREAEILGVVEE